MMKKIAFLALVIVCLLTACKSDKSASYPTLDLLEYGFPLEIKAPEGAEVTKGDLGVLEDVTIKSGDEYYVQIFGSEATEINPSTVKEALKKEIESEVYFSKIIKDEPNGFIFEKKIDSFINYDFRYVKVQADKEYTFQTGLFGKFSEKQVRSMYDCVK